MLSLRREAPASQWWAQPLPWASPLPRSGSVGGLKPRRVPLRVDAYYRPFEDVTT